jgi:hypothetical protein
MGREWLAGFTFRSVDWRVGDARAPGTRDEHLPPEFWSAYNKLDAEYGVDGGKSRIHVFRVNPQRGQSAAPVPANDHRGVELNMRWKSP